MERLAGQHSSDLPGQIVRYGLSGVAIAALYAAVYWAGTALALPAQAANAAGFLAALVAGQALHSRWSFRGFGRREPASVVRYVAVNLAGYLLNCLWVWLTVDWFDAPAALAIFPIVTLTPAFTFIVNRRWTFA